MNCFERYFPAIVDWDGTPERTPFATVEELAEISFVKRFTSWENFSHLAKLRDMLWMVTTEGKGWLLGFMDDPSTVDLPQYCHNVIKE